MPDLSPLVTVCVTAYNQGRYLAQAIESVLEQCFSRRDVFVLDDASTDDSLEVASRYGRHVTVVSSHHNLGLVGAWNKAIALGTAPYIAILHGDDYYLPGMLEKTVSVLESHPSVGFVYGAYQLADSEDHRLSIVQPFLEGHIWPGRREFVTHIRKNYVQCPTVVVRRECYRQLGGFDRRFVFAVDWEMWLRIERSGFDVGYASDPLAFWRIHSESTTRRLNRGGTSLVHDEIAVLDAMFSALPPEDRQLRELRSIAFYELTKRYLLQALLSRNRQAANANWGDALVAYRHGADVGMVPHLFRDALRFVLARKLRPWLRGYSPKQLKR